MLPFIGLVLGALIGFFVIPINIPVQYSTYVGVAILAGMDSIFGGIAAKVQGRYNMKVFLSGFIANALLAAFLAFVGDKLGIPMYLAAVFAFGNRLFNNFAIIRRKLFIDKED